MKLKNKHVFMMVRIIKASGLKTEIVQLIKNRNDKDGESIGIEIFYNLLDVLGEKTMENLLYDFLSDIAGRTPEDIENMDIEETGNLFKTIVEHNNLNSFFRSVTDLTKKV